MPAPRDRAALIKAARMYFLDGRSQDDVARALGTSRSNVSRMLSAARTQGIVEIRVHDQTTREKELETALRERFELAHVRVAAFRPGVDAYAAAGVDSDHETVLRSDALAKLRAGMWLQLREGSAWHDVEKLAPVLIEDGVNSRHALLVTDDMHP